MSGRKRDPVWNNYIEISNTLRDKSGCRAQCKKCGKEMQGLVQRLKDHQKNCVSREESQSSNNADATVQSVASTSTSSVEPSTCSSNPNIELTQSSITTATTASPGTPSSRKRFKSSSLISSFVTSTTGTQKDKIDKQIARAMFATNCSFRAIEHPQVLKAIDVLRPGYKPPSRTVLGDRLLNEVYDEEKKVCFAKLNRQCVCMSIDGWSNVHNDPIICASVTCSSGEVYLYETIDTTGKSHTADYLTEIATDLIKKCKEEHNCQVGSFVTDNASNMTKMRENIKETDNLNIITYGCAAHILNLLSKDLSVRDLREHVVQIIKYFKHNHFASAKYKEEGGKMLVLPQDVRWNSLADCLGTYVSEYQKLFKICEENREKIDSVITQKVTNVMIKRSAEDILKILKPISVTLDKLQKKNSTLSDTVECFKELEHIFAEVDASISQTKALKSRYMQAVTSAHYLCYLLDPTKTKYPLTSEEYDAALQFAQDFFPNSGLLPIIIKLQAKSAPFTEIMFSQEIIKNVRPLEWWKALIEKANYADDDRALIIQALTQLFTATASSASIERVFSSFGLVQSKIRNRLGNEKASKLVFLFKYYNNDD